MFRAFLSSWPLFIGMGSMMLANGLLITLLTVRGDMLGFSETAIGIMQACYPIGALLGCVVAPKLVVSVGHVRVFGALASLCSIAALVHLITQDPYSWSAMRALAGFCFPGLYVVTESWLNAKATNSTRGTLLSLYFVVQTGGFVLGQYLLAIPDPTGTRLFVLSSILISVSLVPILLSKIKAPDFTEPERISIRKLWSISPLGTIGAFSNGIASSMIFIGFGLYAQALDLSAAKIGSFVALGALGGLLGQVPLAKLSDQMDRRYVIAGAALVGSLLCFVLTFFEVAPTILVLLASAMTIPIYSLSVAHTNDYLKPSQVVPASGTLVLVLNAGVIIGPIITASAIQWFGPVGLFWVLGILQMLLFAFTVFRKVSGQDTATDQGAAAAIGYYSTATASELNPQLEDYDKYH